MDKLFIFPFNGNAIEALDCLGTAFECIGFIDDDPKKQTMTFGSHRVFSREALKKHPEAVLLIVPGSSDSYLNRKTLIESFNLAGLRLATVIHPSAQISKHASVGFNTLIMAGVVITSNARIGNHVCILPNTVIHHDTQIADFTIIGSQVTIAGGVSVKENCYIGSSASIIQKTVVGERSLVGMGSTVIASVGAGIKVAGSPARKIGEVV